MAEIDGRPDRDNPQMATTTVAPANTTAWPAVALARPAASQGSIPSVRNCRYRVTTNRQ